jgi:hypothetical protein
MSDALSAAGQVSEERSDRPARLLQSEWLWAWVLVAGAAIWLVTAVATGLTDLDHLIPNVVLLTLAGLASVAAASRDLARAGRLWATVVAMEERRGMQILPFERERYERTLDPYVSDPAFVAAVAEGKGLTQAEALQEVLAPG